MTSHGRVLAAATTLAAAIACGPDVDDALLARSWSGFTRTFVAPDGRVVRPESDHDTVSEGQAYTLLRAAWTNDRETFARVWRWTEAELARAGREAPALLAWHWAPGSGVTDWNVASDADADVALALLVAAERWPDRAENYQAAARSILADLLTHVVVEDEQGASQFLPGAWADQRGEGRGLVLNPSYLAPAWFRVFHRATGDARWLALADHTYTVLDATCDPDGPGVPPDWLRWWSTDRWQVEPRAEAAGWDAIRVPWRIGTDWLWFAEPRARAYLDRCVVPAVRRRLDAGRGMSVEYGRGGSTGDAEHPLANALFAFAFDAPADRDRLLARVTSALVPHGRDLYFGETDRYYVNSLAWLPFMARAGGYTAP